MSVMKLFLIQFGGAGIPSTVIQLIVSEDAKKLGEKYRTTQDATFQRL